jgi:hypothetical protein
MFKRTAGLVKHIFDSQPLLANSTTGFTLFCGGDILAQCRLSMWPSKEKTNNSGDENPQNSIDIARSAKMGVLGVALNGFCLHGWYRLLDRAFGRQKGKSWNSVLPKMVADQIVYAPFADAAFLVWAAVLRGGSPETIYNNAKNNLDHSFVRAFIVDCQVWPLANLVGFRFVPTNYRPTYIGVIQLGWQAYMSSIGHEHASGGTGAGSGNHAGVHTD